MEANEFRIGNTILNHKNKIVNIDLRIFEYIYSHNESEKTNKLFKPIELTEEWLNKLGLRRNKEAEVSTYQRWEQVEGHNIGLYFFTFFKNAVGQWIFRLVFPESKGGLYSPGMNNLMYVHQLQNLYFALIGKELEYK